VQAAGGNVIMPPFDVGDQGRMAVFQDPSGAFIAAWQRKAMGGFHTHAPNTFGWAELNARGIDKAVPFYRAVFGWTDKRSEMGEGQPPYIEFQLGGESIAGGMEMNPMVPAEVPSYWMVYFNVEDVDKSFKDATGAGGREVLAPQDFPGGRFAIVSDPHGAVFGLMKMQAACAKCSMARAAPAPPRAVSLRLSPPGLRDVRGWRAVRGSRHSHPQEDGDGRSDSNRRHPPPAADGDGRRTQPGVLHRPVGVRRRGRFAAAG
jgi:predicted enzyme related to lactoylglutathione lyase